MYKYQKVYFQLFSLHISMFAIKNALHVTKFKFKIKKSTQEMNFIQFKKVIQLIIISIHIFTFSLSIFVKWYSIITDIIVESKFCWAVLSTFFLITFVLLYYF